MFKHGIAASSGVGIGSAVIIRGLDTDFKTDSELSADEESARFDSAAAEFIRETTKMADTMRANVGENEAEILIGHTLMVSDPSMTGEVKKRIKDGITAEAAVSEVFDKFAALFESSGDELTMQRATDIRDIKTRLIGILCGAVEVDISTIPPGSVIVANDLTPSMTAGINKQNIAAIVTESGGRTAHSAILARALEIPAVLGIDGITDELSDGINLIVDGTQGDIISKPSGADIAKYEALKLEYESWRHELQIFKAKPTVTADGAKIDLFCNIGKPDDCAAVIENSGEGIGLFRTEFLYMDSDSAPSEDEQFEAYKKAVMTMKGRPVIIRTLDVGGDKDIPYLNLEKEDNPFMGFRAIRYCIANEELYKTQLRALLRASVFGDIRIMIPLVTCAEEVRTVKAMVESAMYELDRENIEYNSNVPIGAMIETPAAAVMADVIAKEADFFSIGTNDLTGYTMAVDRGNAKAAYLYSVYNPAVIRSIKRIIEAAKKAQIYVGMCGEAAADPMLAPILISFGLDEYSVSPSAVLKTRRTLSLWSKAEADRVTAAALLCETESDLREMLTENAKQ